MPSSVRWWLVWPWKAPAGSATANPANSIVASEGMGTQALSASISTNTAGRPASRTKCDAVVTSDSVTDASTNTRPP